MARLDDEAFDGYMKGIMAMYENPDDCADMITALREDHSEAVPDDMVSKAQYEDLKEKYVARFFGGDAKMKEAKADQKKDVRQDMKDLTYDELLKDYKHESYNGKDE